VVAGTHGKTTTTSLASFALQQLGENPGFLVGGVPLDLSSGNELGEPNSPFVIEGDEYDSAFFDKRSKFIHYRPRILILNNLEFDHGDIFRDLMDISRSFSHLLRVVPENGFILRNGDDQNIMSLPNASWCETFSIGMGENNDFRILEFAENREGVYFQLHWRGKFITEVNWGMAGEFNARNLAMSLLGSILVQAARHERTVDASNPFADLQIPDYTKCKGVKRRQEILIDQPRVVVMSDFAHHPTAIEGTLQSIRSRWPDRKIVACFEPRSNTAVTNIFQDRFADSLAVADEVLLGSVHRADKIPAAQRINTRAMIQRMQDAGKKGTAFSDNQKLAEFLESSLTTEEPVLVVFFSNGSFDGVMDRFSKFSENL
jgi:UDP-N-acetylmuramate: L-alanyl-gamma-D-glutamyl-meso-diaminopimelate ligase